MIFIRLDDYKSDKKIKQKIINNVVEYLYLNGFRCADNPSFEGIEIHDPSDKKFHTEKIKEGYSKYMNRWLEDIKDGYYELEKTERRDNG